MPVIRCQHQVQLGKPFIPTLLLPAHLLESLPKLPALHPIWARMNLQLSVFPDTQGTQILWLYGSPGDPTALLESIFP